MTAMLIVALAASAAIVLLGRVDRWIERVAIGRDKAQARELAHAGIAYGRAVLLADASTSAIDTLDEDWARVLPPLRLDGHLVSGRIEDLQGRFNLNNLRRNDGSIDEAALTAYRRLLASLGMPEMLADTLADWLDADDNPRAAGLESSGYRKLGAENGSLNRPLPHLATLSRVHGYTPALIERLLPFVCALSGIQPVNLNTASAEVLAAVQPSLGLAAARALIRSRQGSHFRDAADFQQALGDSSLPPPLVPVATNSRHFVVHVEVAAGLARSRFSALVQRIENGRRTRILWQSQQ